MQVKKRNAIFFIITVLITLAPVVFLLKEGLFLPQEDLETWEFVSRALLPKLITNTFALLIMVALSTLVIGVSQAFLVVYTDIPFKKLFNILFILPISLPLYVTAFVYSGLMEYSGTLPTYLRQQFGINIVNYLNIKGIVGVIFVFSLCLSPYVYLMSKNAFQNAGSKMLMVARSMGLNSYNYFLKVLLPYSRPWIFAASGIVMMETLADFGAVSVLGYDTFTTAIYQAWSSLFSLSSAARLSSILVVFALAILILESKILSKYNFFTSKNKNQDLVLVHLTGGQKVIAASVCAIFSTLSLFIPIYNLVVWSLEVQSTEWNIGYLKTLSGSLYIGFIGAVVISILGLLMAFISRRREPILVHLKKLCLLGYSLPGTIIAVALIIFFSYVSKVLDVAFLSIGGISVLIVGYTIRFLNVGSRVQDAATGSIHHNIERAARSLGANSKRVLLKIFLPLISGAFTSAFVLSFVEILKEMPITLMLKPYKVDTLAVKIYGYTSEGEWEMASVAGIFLVIASMVSVFVLNKLEDRFS